MFTFGAEILPNTIFLWNFLFSALFALMVKRFKIMNLIFYTSWSLVNQSMDLSTSITSNSSQFVFICLYWRLQVPRIQWRPKFICSFYFSKEIGRIGSMDNMSVRTEDAAQALDSRLRLPWEFSYRRDKLWQAVTCSHYNIVTLVSHYQAQCPAQLVSVMFCHYFPVICRKRLMLKGCGTRVDTVTRMNGIKMTGLNKYVVISTIVCFMMTC